MRTLIIFFIAIVSFAATPALAQQFSDNSFLETQSTIVLKPEYPRPGEQVTASMSDYGGGLYGSSISWLINGVAVPNSENQREITFTAGDLGTSQTIDAVLTKPNNGHLVLHTTVTPVYLDIVVEPQTRVPNFYLGRALPSIGSLVNATALVNDGKQTHPEFVYTWRINQQVIERGPIRGRNQVSFEMPMGQSAALSLQVTDLKGSVIASRAVLLPSVAPEIHFYEVSTLFGESSRSFTGPIPLIGNSVTVQAEPYYLDSRVYNNPSIKEWTVDGAVSRNLIGNPYEVTLQRVRASGSSQLEFHVRDTTQILQGANATIQVNF